MTPHKDKLETKKPHPDAYCSKSTGSWIIPIPKSARTDWKHLNKIHHRIKSPNYTQFKN